MLFCYHHVVKKLLALLSLTFLLTACSWQPVAYHNKVLTTTNELTLAIETTAAVYHDSVPELVTEESKIDSTLMEEAYSAAKLKYRNAAHLVNIESENTKQTQAALAKLTPYLESAEAYLDNYKELTAFFKKKEYKDSVPYVGTLDEQFNEHHNNFIEANNDLASTLAELVDTVQ